MSNRIMHDVKSLAKAPSSKRTFNVMIMASVVTLAVYTVPFLSPIAYPFLLLSTLVHEMAHGLVAILCGGQFESFRMWADGSGVANIHGDFSPLSRAMVAAAGLVGPAFVAGAFFLAVKHEHHARFLLALSAIILVLSIMLVVRNLFGVFFVGIICALLFYFSLGGGKKHSQLVLSLIAVQLALSVFSRSDYLFTSTAMTAAGPMPSDVALMASALFLPYWFWGALCGLISVLVVGFGLHRLFK